MWRDDAYLLDMLLAARKALDFTRDATWDKFRNDELLQNAVMHAVQTIGEAARKVSKEFQEGHPSIKWHAIVSMRNRLVHEYFRIIPDRVWKVVIEDLRPLVEQLQALVPPDIEPPGHL